MRKKEIVLLILTFGFLFSTFPLDTEELNLTHNEIEMVNGVYSWMTPSLNLSEEKDFSWGKSKYSSMGSLNIDLERSAYEVVGNYCEINSIKKTSENEFLIHMSGADTDFTLRIKHEGDGQYIFITENLNYPPTNEEIKMYKLDGPGIIYLGHDRHAPNSISSYQNGNGQIIDSGEDDDYSWVVRKHEQQVEIGELSKSYNRILFEQPNGDSPIIRYLKFHDKISVKSIRINQNKVSKKKDHWMNIETEEGESGWIEFGYDPYRDDEWIIFETISTSSGIWTSRKYDDQYYYVTDILNVRSIPGLTDSTVLFQLRPDIFEGDLGIRTLAMTEETETIDGMDEPWFKIRDPEGRIGWIFSGYARSDKGGPRYWTPEKQVNFSLSWY